MPASMLPSFQSKRSLMSALLFWEFLWMLEISCLSGGTAFSKAETDYLPCDLYLAPSTIPNAGLGVFTGVSKDIGDVVGNGDVAFPMVELAWHNEVAQNDADYFDPFLNYVWDGATMGMADERSDLGGDVVAMWPGLDCAINCLIPLENVKRAFPRHPSHGRDDYEQLRKYLPHRSKDPGAGAITPYRSGETFVKRAIPAGGELFKDYGGNWFLTRPMFEGLPLKKDFKKAQKIVDRWHKYLNRNEDLWQFIMVEVKGIWPTSRTLNALPLTKEDRQLALTKSISDTYQANATKSIEWLNEHGKCMDHIIPKPSTIKGAGEGAFAKRDLPKSTVITGSPLLAIPDAKFLNMFEFTMGTTENMKTEATDVDVENGYDASSEWVPSEAPFTRQVVYNYVYGHPESTMLFFPYGNGVNYINHNQTLANVKLQWSEDGTTAHEASWLSRPPGDFLDEYSPHLGIDYIATRDIHEGEELFLDYGDLWEEAWSRHVIEWVPPIIQETAGDWNAKMDQSIRTQTEQEIHPYPSTVGIRCHTKLVSDEEWRSHSKDNPSMWDLYVRGKEEAESVYGLPCNITARNDATNTYNITIGVDWKTYALPLGYIEEDGPENQNFPLENVPREAIFFYDLPSQSDLYLKNTFRHFITLPDEIMPAAWRNKLQTKGKQSPDSSTSDEL